MPTNIRVALTLPVMALFDDTATRAILYDELRSETERLLGDLVEQIQQQLPEGPMRESIEAKVELGMDASALVTGQVFTEDPRAIYVEEDTQPHDIVPRFKAALFWPGARHPVRRVHHPGTTGTHMFRQAEETLERVAPARAQQAVDRAAQRLGEAL